jgi:hypothetical protein
MVTGWEDIEYPPRCLFISDKYYRTSALDVSYVILGNFLIMRLQLACC